MSPNLPKYGWIAVATFVPAQCVGRELESSLRTIDEMVPPGYTRSQVGSCYERVPFDRDPMLPVAAGCYREVKSSYSAKFILRNSTL